ncbi:MAG TPA: glycosyltransferase, partial [Streptomyces sp.]
MLHKSCTEDRQLTVLHLVQPVEGGVAGVVIDLVAAQVRAGLRPVVACPPGGVLADGAAAAGAQVRTWPADRAPGPRLAREVTSAARLVRACAPDVVHAHSAKAGLAGRLAVRGRVPTVFQPHAWSFEALQGRAAGLARQWERFGARWCDHILCVSESERLTGQRAGIAARWSVIHNGIDLGRFRPGGREGREVARGELPLLAEVPAGAPLVVCIGRLSRQKGQDVLLRAWQRMRVPGARLVLVGDGPSRDGLREAAPADVLFAGAVDDVRPWIHAADV